MTQAKLLLIVIFLSLSACGGGGGSGGGSGGGNNQSLPPLSVSSSIALSSSSSSSAVNSVIDLKKLTRVNTPLLAGGLVDLIGFSKSIPQDLMSAFADINGVGDGKYTVACDNTGSSYTATISGTGTKIIESFNECIFDGVHYSGSRTIEMDVKKSSSVAVIYFGWTNFKIYEVAAPGESETINGKADYEGQSLQYADNDNKFLLHLDLEIYSSIEGTLLVKNGVFALTYPNPFSFMNYDYYFSDEQDMSGTLSFRDVGAVNFSTSEQSRIITLVGAENSKAYIDPAVDIMEIALDENGDGVKETNVNISPYEFNSQTGLSDIVNNTERHIILRTGVSHSVFDWQGLMMGRGGSLLIDISKLFTQSSADLLDYTLRVDGFTESTDVWNQTSAGVFNLIFSNNIVDEAYKLTFMVSDLQGNSYELPVNLFVGGDFDGDNIPDVKDSDDDNDNEPDYSDKFPLDPLDSKDFDNDGIGDNRDTDIDNDGTLNLADAYPRDANCSILTAGNGEQCYSSFSSDLWFMDSAGIVYSQVYAIHESVIRYLSNRWDSKTGEFIEPLALLSFDYHLYSKETQKIFSNSNRSLYVIDPTSEISSVLVENISNFSIKYIEQNHIVIIRQLSGASDSEIAESYNMNGQLISTVMTYQNDRKTPVVAPKFSHLCDSHITTDVNGVFSVVLDAQQSLNCFFGLGDMDYSPNRARYFSYLRSSSSAAIYSADRSFMFNVEVANRVASFWTQSGFVVVEADPLTLKANLFSFYNDAGEISVRFSYPQDEEHIDVVNNSESVVLLTRVLLTKQLRARIFDKDLNLLSVRDY